MWLNEKDWAEFRKKFRAASAWIDQRELENELTYLRSMAWLSPHQKRRLDELEKLPHVFKAVNAKQ